MNLFNIIFEEGKNDLSFNKFILVDNPSLCLKDFLENGSENYDISMEDKEGLRNIIDDLKRSSKDKELRTEFIKSPETPIICLYSVEYKHWLVCFRLIRVKRKIVIGKIDIKIPLKNECNLLQYKNRPLFFRWVNGKFRKEFERRMRKKGNCHPALDDPDPIYFGLEKKPIEKKEMRDKRIKFKN